MGSFFGHSQQRLHLDTTTATSREESDTAPAATAEAYAETPPLEPPSRRQRRRARVDHADGFGLLPRQRPI